MEALTSGIDREYRNGYPMCGGARRERRQLCLYLGVLGKYGYVEPVPDVDGREKPWRVKEGTQDLSPTDTSSEALVASAGAIEAFLVVEFEQMKANLRAWPQEDAVWADATGIRGSTVNVTARELREIGAQMQAILEPFELRTAEASRRPPRTRPARIFMSATVPPERPPRS